MDDNKEKEKENLDNEQNVEEKKENPFKNPKFYLGLVVGLIPLIYLVAFDYNDNDVAFEIEIFILSIYYLIGGGIIWLLLRKWQRPLALGFLSAGVTPSIITFLLMGGCILSGNY